MVTMLQTAITLKKAIRIIWFCRVAYLIVKSNMDESNAEKYKRQAWNATKYLIIMELIFRISYLIQNYYGR